MMGPHRRSLVSRLLLLITFLLSVGGAYSNDEKKSGFDQYKEGVRLVQEDRLDEAAMNFWGSIMAYAGLKEQGPPPYKVDEAMNNFLMCHQKQNKLGMGYAFVAAQMHKMKDARARMFLQKAYEVDPTNEDILQLIAHMGETTDTILSSLSYSPDDDDDDDDDDDTDTPQKPTKKPHACRTRADCRRLIDEPPNYSTLEPGWEEKVERDHVYTERRLINTPPINITIPPLPQFEVYYDSFWINHFYPADQNGKKNEITSWEPYTFEVLHKYITKETVMVDLGAWCGPTTLFGGQLAKRVFSLEPDPVAYTTLQMNLKLNRKSEIDDSDESVFPNNVHLNAIAVVAPHDAGYVVLETGKKGNSESMIVKTGATTKSETFEAAGYTLPFLFNLWGIQFEDEQPPVFIKIDIEAYECRLLPSFHEWLSAETIQNRLTMFVSFHPQLRPCTKYQMKGVLKTFQLFSTVECNQQRLPSIKDDTTFEQFESMLDTAGCLTDKDTSDFVLIA